MKTKMTIFKTEQSREREKEEVCLRGKASTYSRVMVAGKEKGGGGQNPLSFTIALLNHLALYSTLLLISSVTKTLFQPSPLVSFSSQHS